MKAIKCTCHLKSSIDASDFYGCRRICLIHKWVLLQGSAEKPTEPEPTTSLEAEVKVPEMSVDELRKELKTLFKRGGKVKGSRRRDYIKNCIAPKVHYDIKSKKLSRQLAIIYGYSLTL